jgi:fructan beta-fructosidase
MKQSFIFIIFSLLCLNVFSQGNSKDVWFDEAYRPQYHFTPQENRMGNPISIVKTDSTYHLFYQWNPHNLQDGFVNWGYATSYDLLKWKHEGIALSQPEGVADSMLQTPWWGSVVNKDGKLTAWSNSWNDGIYRYTDFSKGKWGSSEKVKGVDQLTKSEPYVFWHAKTNKWVMVAFNNADSVIYINNSPDGLTWTQTSKFNFKYGFASLTELPVDNNPDDTLWLFITDSGNYMLVKFDGEKIDLVTAYKEFDQGKNVGGSFILKDQPNNRALLFSLLKSEQQADLPSNGMLSFPTEITLHKTNAGVELIRKPATEITKLYKKNTVWDNKKIYPGINNNLLQGVRGDCFHIKGTIDIKNCDYFGIVVRSNRDNVGTDINYNVEKSEMSLEGSRITAKPENNKIEFEMLIDRSSVELFINGGKYVASTTIDPEPKSLRYMLYTIGGEIQVDHLEIHELKSAWR